MLAGEGASFPEFHAFTAAHAASVAVCTGVICALVVLGRRARRDGRESLVIVPWAIFGFAVNIWSLVYWLVPERFSITTALPFQLCDLACLVAPISLLSNRRIFSTLIVFWGLGLSLQGFITPTVPVGFPSARFLLFWGLHTVIIATAVYQLVVRRYRPNFKDCLWAIGVSTSWCYSMFALNLVLDSNYGFVGKSKPGQPTIVDLLGPWPGRVFILSALVISLFIVMWAVLRERTAKPRS